MKRTITTEDLMKMGVQNSKNIIENFLSQGITILAGDSKIGNTYLLQQLAVALTFKNKKTDFLDLKITDNNIKVYFITDTDILYRLHKQIEKCEIECEALEDSSLYISSNASSISYSKLEDEILNINNKREKDELALFIIDVYSKDMDIFKYEELSKKYNVSFLITAIKQPRLANLESKNLYDLLNDETIRRCSSILYFYDERLKDTLGNWTKPDYYSQENKKYSIEVLSNNMPENVIKLEKKRKDGGFFSLRKQSLK